MRRLGIGILMLGICWGARINAGAAPARSPAAAEGKPSVSVVSLIVVREVDDTALSALMDAPGGEFKTGVMLVGRVVLPAGNVVSVDKALKVDSFTDDKGTDFGNGAVKARFVREEGQQCYMSPDGKQCTFWLGSGTLPAAGAEKLLVEGSLGLQLGVGEKSGESKKLALKLGQEFEVGEMKLKVEELSMEGREGGLHVAFSSATALGQIKAIECTDGEGKPVAVEMDGRQRGEGSLGITLSRSVKEMTLRVVAYEKIESVKVPVKLEVKVGL